MATAVRKPRMSGGGGLNRKVGPLPLWAWAAIGVAGVVAGIYLKNRLAASTQQSSQSAAPSVPTVGTTYPDVGGATSGGAAGSGIAPNEFSDFSALLGTLESAGLLGGQASPTQTGTPQISVAEPAITLPAPIVTYVTAPAKTSGGKVITSARAPLQTVSPIIASPGANPLPGIPNIGRETFVSPAGETLATVYSVAPTRVTTPPVAGRSVAAARPGGVSANKQQGVYAIH